MTHLTTLAELKRHITLLACVEESGAPVVSAYFNLENGEAGWRETLNERARVLRRVVKGYDRADFEEALGKIEDWLVTDLLPDALGAAIFVRGRFGGAFMLVMASDYHPDPGWLCTACRAIGIEVPETPVCPQCGEYAVRSVDVREALLRLAGQLERPAEVVEQSDALMSLGGVGCLLRYGSDFRFAKPDEQDTTKGMTSGDDLLRAVTNDPPLRAVS